MPDAPDAPPGCPTLPARLAAGLGGQGLGGKGLLPQELRRAKSCPPSYCTLMGPAAPIRDSGRRATVSMQCVHATHPLHRWRARAVHTMHRMHRIDGAVRERTSRRRVAPISRHGFHHLTSLFTSPRPWTLPCSWTIMALQRAARRDDRIAGVICQQQRQSAGCTASPRLLAGPYHDRAKTGTCPHRYPGREQSGRSAAVLQPPRLRHQ
jgi:hypothetical protein